MSAQNLLKNVKLGFVGAGNMARSLIGGLLKQGLSANHIMTSDPSAECQDAARALGVNVLPDNAALVAKADVLVLAVKPQVMKEVVVPLVGSLAKRKPLVISIAAGINSDAIKTWSGVDLPIVRCMPNTPALVQLGATGLFANGFVSAEQKVLAQAMLEAVGIALWVEREEQLDAVTALSGSGPAYYFLLMELMQKSGEALGLSPEAASELTLQTALGAAKMAIESDVDAAELRRRVTSPNGTTQAAIESFQASGIESAVANALKAAHQRSIELSRQLG